MSKQAEEGRPAPEVTVQLLLSDESGTQLLLLPAADGWQLPQVTLPDFHVAQAQPLCRAVARELGVAAIVLRCRRRLKEDGVVIAYIYDMAAVAPETATADGRWFRATALPALPDPTGDVAAWLAERDPARVPTGRPPWARPNWWPRLTGWIKAEVAARGWQLTGPMVQERAWGISTVVTVPTSGGMLYAKATSDIFAYECLKTHYLARRNPALLPRLLALAPERDWLLMAAVPGRKLSEHEDPALWRQAAAVFSQLQLSMAGHDEWLLAQGFADRRLDWLLARWTPIMADDAFLATWLTAAESEALRALAPRIEARVAEIAAVGLPNTVVHGDLHASNIIIGPDAPVFIDWSDACLGHPFMDQLLLLTVDSGVPPPLRTPAPALAAARLAPWTAYASLPELARAYERATPLLFWHQATAYYDIVNGLEPGARWELGGGFAWFVRRLLLYYAD